MTKEEQELYDSDLKAKSDWNAGIEWAKKQEAIKIAHNFLKSGFTPEQVSAGTGLSLEEVQKLQS